MPEGNKTKQENTKRVNKDGTPHHTLAEKFRVYRKRFKRLDKKTQYRIIGVIILVILVFLSAIFALFGKGKNPASDLQGSGAGFSGSYDSLADLNYNDEYSKELEEYRDVVLPENDIEDRNYIRETLFVGDSNTEALAAYNILSLQYVVGVTGMPIQSVPSSKCIYFVGYDNPVTIPTAVGMLKPRRIIINFGTNNAGGTSTDDFIDYYKIALDSISDAYPYADIIIESVFPVAKSRDYPNITMQDIDEYNIALARMCQELGYKYLNTTEVLKDPKTGFIKREYISSDGIHLNSEGLNALVNYVSSHKYITKDTRPARGKIPTRKNAPYVPESDSLSSSSSSLSSSSESSSSSISSSEIISSSSESSSSTSVGTSSSSSVPPESSTPSSEVIPPSAETSSSEPESTPENTPPSEETPPPTAESPGEGEGESSGQR